ncbi:MAG: polyhydroxyalkanoic acid system family protein [Bradymonadaceae bacterium]
MKDDFEHGLPKAKAKQATQKAFDAYKKRFEDYNPQANWVSDDEAEVSFSAKGMTLDGRVKVTDTAIQMEMDVPFLLKPFKNKALDVIEDEINKWVEKAKRGELEDIDQA